MKLISWPIDEVNEGYHDELYGYLMYRKWLDGYRQNRPKRTYIKQNRKGANKSKNIDLTDYIRHQIHHPENMLNVHFTLEELKQSTEDMREYIRNRLSSEMIEGTVPNDE